MIELPQKFIDRMKPLLNDSLSGFLSSYNRSAYKAIRVNTLKISVGDFKKISPFKLSEGVEWEDSAFYVEEEKAGKTVEHAAGLYYVQEPSAMSAAPLLKACAGERVLDMCSAPGGKGTQLAQRMCGEGIIVLNEINYPRAKILSQNVERLGITNAMVTCCTPSAVAKAYEGYFDKVLVDAPCSGEGMFLKEENALSEWSEDNVISCAKRQSEILDSAQRTLKRGGLLVYSTCTFSREEDEWQIESFLKSHKNFKLLGMKKLFPHEIKGEGHFVALMQKEQGEDKNIEPFRFNAPDTKQMKVFKCFEESALKREFNNLHVAKNTLYSIPDSCPAFLAEGSLIRAGIRLGEFEGDRFEPSHSLAMCLKKGEAQSVEVDRETAIKYLKGLTFDCPQSIKGWAPVTYSGYPLGWCKCVGGIAKNHLPKGLRI